MSMPTKLDRVVANCKELKTLYIHYYNACNYQTWQRNDLGIGSLGHKDTDPIIKGLTWGYVTNLESFIFTFTKLGAVVT